MDEQEFIDRFGMTRDEYGQRYGVLEDPNQGKGATLREKTVDATANFLQGLGSDQYFAYKTARDLFGNPNADLSESIGIMDFTPAQLPFAIQEGKRALQRGDTAEGVLDLGFAGLEMFPAAKLATTPIKGFFSSLASKLSKSTDNLGALPTDPSRRTAMATMAAAPIVAGTLGDLPVSKIIDDVVPVSDIPAVTPVSKKIVGNIVKNIGQPSRTETIGELMDLTDFGIGTQYGKETMEESVKKFSSEINKAKKYFELKKKTLDQDELDMISTNSDMADYLENLQIEFGYTDDQIIKFIDETDSTTRKNTKSWETYLESGGEGDPDIGKKFGLGDESEGWENWGEDDFWDKFYGSNEADIAGNTIAKADE